MNYLKIFTVIASTLVLHSVHAETVVSTPVDGGMTSGVELQCTAYMHMPDKIPQNSNLLPIYFVQFQCIFFKWQILDLSFFFCFANYFCLLLLSFPCLHDFEKGRTFVSE